jgi:uncharacterized protein (TIGR03437 family)
MNISRFLVAFLFLSLGLRATVITLGPSTQAVTFTGTGTGATGAGTSVVSWGACSFDGTNTTCTVSGPYTGLGDGGTYSFVLTYPGNGASVFGAVASPPGTDLVYFTLTAGTFRFTITPVSGPPVSFPDLNFEVFFDPTTDSCSVVSVCSVGAVGESIGGTITGPVHGTFDPTPVINVGGIVTATDYGGFPSIAPATFVEIYGLNLSTSAAITWGNSFQGNQAPTALGGTTATVAGQTAYVELSSAHQVNVLVPSGVPTGPQPVVITTFGGSSVATTVTVNAVSPGVLAPAAFKSAAGQYAFAVFPDNKTYDLPPTVVPALPTARAKPGDVIIMYGNGFGPVNPDLTAGTLVHQTNALPSFQAAFAGVQADVQFAGLVQTYTGLYQFNIVVPKVAASDKVPFTFTLDGVPGTQTLFLPVGN